MAADVIKHAWKNYNNRERAAAMASAHRHQALWRWGCSDDGSDVSEHARSSSCPSTRDSGGHRGADMPVPLGHVGVAAADMLPSLPGLDQPCYVHLFSGPNHPDSLHAMLSALGGLCVCIDTCIDFIAHDLNNPVVRATVRHFIATGNIRGVALGVSCRSFSVLWERLALRKPYLRIRSRGYPDGVPQPPGRYREYIRSENSLVAFAADVMLVAANRNIPVFFEQPADRGDASNPLTYRAQFAGHASMFLSTPMQHLLSLCLFNKITMPQCALGSPYQARLPRVYCVSRVESSFSKPQRTLPIAPHRNTRPSSSLTT